MKKVFELEWEDKDMMAVNAARIKDCLNSVVNYCGYFTRVVELTPEKNKRVRWTKCQNLRP